MRFWRRIFLVGFSASLTCIAAISLAWNQGIPVAVFSSKLASVEDPSIAMKSFRGGLLNPSLAVPSAIADHIRDAGRSDPLAEEYVLVAALEQRSSLTPKAFADLLEVVRRRNPRNRLARLLLVEAYLRDGNAERAAKELASFELLEKEMHPTLIPILKVMVEQPSTQEVTIEAVQGSRLQRMLALAMARDLAEPDIVLRLSGIPSPKEFSPQDENWVANVVGQYVSGGRIDEAYFLWRKFFGLANSDVGTVTDPSFSGFPGPPFGWRLAQQAGGLAVIDNELLQVTYYGRERWLIAEQILALRPGRYRLLYELGSGDANLPNLVWQIECEPRGGSVLSLPFSEEELLYGVDREYFSIGSEQCPVQRLSLSARPRDRATTRSATIREVQILPVDGS